MPSEIAIVGAGTMGAGIAQLAIEHGSLVCLIDVDPAASERARARIAAGLGRHLARVGLAGSELESARAERLERLRLGTDPDDAAGAAVVIEAIVEQLTLKRSLFARLDRILPPEVILATNTSALSVGAIARAAEVHPERVVGLHFFNPAPRMALVEVVAAERTAVSVAAAAVALVRSWDRTPIRCADRPGFVVNRVNRPFTIQALRVLEVGLAGVATIDTAVRAAGFPMGPFELMDFVGIDVNLAAATGVWEGFDRAPRFRPSPIQAGLATAGRLGRKSGVGFYRYGSAGNRLGPAPEFEDSPSPDHAHSADPDVAGRLVDRIRLAIVNEAFRALDEGLAADEATNDDALRLGAGHPVG
ncbi:MAG: 3-hydroxyacyl-CoA dehydrogenase NAD-binding domain-containing protein, partial [Candidatus Limnocylindrales bacterium]